MRVLLISPMYNSSIVAHCLGLGYLASALKKNGHDVLILDGLREKIEYNPSEWDIVGVSAMSTYFQSSIYPSVPKIVNLPSPQLGNASGVYQSTRI